MRNIIPLFIILFKWAVYHIIVTLLYSFNYENVFDRYLILFIYENTVPIYVNMRNKKYFIEQIFEKTYVKYLDK